MEPAFNIQCAPTPTMWQGGAIALPDLGDEDGYTLTDEDGNTLQPG